MMNVFILCPPTSVSLNFSFALQNICDSNTYFRRTVILFFFIANES